MASTSISKTFSSNGNRKKWTFSAWIKRTGLGSVQRLLSCDEAGNNNHDDFYQFQSDNTLVLGHYDSGYYANLSTNRKFQDVNGWYHFVITWDTAQVTSSDRFKFYVNGVQETSFSTATYPSVDADSFINTTEPMEIGKRGDNDTQFLDALLTHVHFCDGYAYSASDFGETDSNGVWTIKTSPSVSYGTNGFFILKDGNSLTDQSPNSNDWTSVSGTLTNLKDNPDNVFATMNPLDNYEQGSTFTIGNTKLEWNTNNKNNFANFTINKGKFYWEMKYANNTGGTDAMIGMSLTDTRQGDDYPGHDSTAWSYYASNGNKYHSGGSSYGDSYTTNDIIGVAFDADTRTLWFSKNGVWQNSATISEIAAGTTTNAAWTGMGSAGDWFIPCMSGYDGNKAEFNFGNGYFSTTQITDEGTNASGIGKFEYDVPNNFTALCTKGLNE